MRLICDTKGERNTYWGEIKTIIHNIPKNDLSIWATDNNGKIAKRDTTLQEEQHHAAHNGIGKWHYGKTAGKEMVKNGQNDRAIQTHRNQRCTPAQER